MNWLTKPGLVLMAMLVLAACSLTVDAQATGKAAADQAAGGTTVTIYTKDNAPPTPKLADLPLKESVSRWGITWTFEKPARVGQFVNGDYYVVGEVAVKMIDPKPLWDDEVKDVIDADKKKSGGKYVRNGCILNINPTDTAKSGFDSRCSKYYPGYRVDRPPIAMKPGDTLISTISEDKPHGVSGGTSPTKSVAVLTCLKEAVPPDAFRSGYSDRQQKIYLARNLRRELLPKLSRLPGTPRDWPAAELSYEALLSKYTNRFAGPWLDIAFFGVDSAPYQEGGYGAAVARASGTASLLLMLDYKPEEKEPLLVNHVQYGLDLWGLVRSGHPGWQAHGGHGAGRKWPIVFAGIMLGEADMAAVSKTFPKVKFQEDMQTMFDDCWTGAGVVYAGHVGKDGYKGHFGWGLFEHLHPSRWPSDIPYPTGNAYRVNSTQENWIGQVLAARIIGAEEAWGNDAYFVNQDRWMTEPDPGYGTGAAFAIQGSGKVQFQIDMWKAYRNNLPAVGGREIKPRPPTGWQKTRELKSVPVAIDQRAFRVAGRPFFPLMMFAEHPKRIDDALAIGVNTIAEGSFESPQLWNAHVNNREFLDKLAEKKLYGVFGADMRTAGHPNLLGWIHLDEPDRLLNYSPEQRNTKHFLWRNCPGVHPYTWMKWALERDPEQKGKDEALVLVGPAYRWMKKTDASRPVFLTIGPAFFKASAEKNPVCADYLANCNVVGCRVPAAQVGESVATLRQLAPEKPVFAWVETRGAKPEEVRTAVRAAISHGATAIGYRGFEGYGDEKPDAAVMAELKKLNEQITRNAAELLTNPAKAEELLR